MYNSMTTMCEPPRSVPTGLLVLFSHHGARQDIHISYSPGPERFPRSGDGVDLWAEDGTEDGSLHNSPGYPNRSALVRFEPSGCVSSSLIWARINSPGLSHLLLYARSALSIGDPGALAPSWNHQQELHVSTRARADSQCSAFHEPQLLPDW